MLFSAVIFGEIARYFRQPAIIGEIAAGIILGPTILGSIFPEFHDLLFPSAGNVKIVIDGLTTVAIALFLLVAGMEVDLSMVFRQGRTTMIIGMLGMVGPFLLGFIPAFLMPGALGKGAGISDFVFALFIATAFSISALPVVAKILKDLDLYKTDLGMLIIGAAIFNDIMGWMIFAVVLNLAGTMQVEGPPIGEKLALMFAFVIVILTAGKMAVHRVLPWIQAHLSFPAGLLGLAITAAFISAAITQWIGIHAIFGAFIFGVALGDSPHLREKTRATIDQFVSFIFAPLFFVGIGLHINFIANFDLFLVLFFLIVASVGKVVFCRLGGFLSGMSGREAWAAGFGLNARGAMEIILGSLALPAGIITEKVFVALVILALVTSISSGSLMQYVLRRRMPLRFSDFLNMKTFKDSLAAHDRFLAIEELVHLAANGTGMDPSPLVKAVWQREQIMSTGLAEGIAIPHARIAGLREPVLAAGISRHGIDFDAIDGQPAHIIFLILTPKQDNAAQIEILADIGRTFRSPGMTSKVLQTTNFTEFLALIKSETYH